MRIASISKAALHRNRYRINGLINYGNEFDGRNDGTTMATPRHTLHETGRTETMTVGTMLTLSTHPMPSRQRHRGTHCTMQAETKQ